MGVLSVQVIASSTTAVAAYLYVYQHDVGKLGVPAWLIWGSSILLGCLGIVIIAAQHTRLLFLHLICEVLLVAVVSSVSVSWYFTLRNSCSMSQKYSFGCEICPCAQDDSCTDADMVNMEGCGSCEAISVEACDAFRSSAYNLAISLCGLVILLAGIPAICMDIVLIKKRVYHYISLCARRNAVKLFVDQQTRLLSAGDAPTVTPGTLHDWIVELELEESYPPCQTAAQACRSVLQQRGFVMKSTSKSTHDRHYQHPETAEYQGHKVYNKEEDTSGEATGTHSTSSDAYEDEESNKTNLQSIMEESPIRADGTENIARDDNAPSASAPSLPPPRRRSSSSPPSKHTVDISPHDQIQAAQQSSKDPSPYVYDVEAQLK